MDKLKEQLAPVQKHLFWILCGCILGVCLFSWWRATAALQVEQEQYKAEIDQKTQAVSAINEPHPNDATIKGMDELIRAYGEDVANGWARLAAHQEKVLVWPAVFDRGFVEAVEPLRPPELKVTNDILQEISADHRRFARDRFAEALPNLATTIGAKWKGTHQGGGMGGMGTGMGMGMGGAGGMEFLRGGAGAAGAGQPPGIDILGEGAAQEEVDDSIVLWDPGNQSELLSVHFDFTASDEAIPKTIQVLYAQEDLWVLQNIMDIIKATNGDATQRHEAAVKTIESVRLGRSAFGLAGQITGVSGTGAGGMGMGMGGSSMPGMGMPGMGDPGMGMGMQGAAGAGMPSTDGGAGGAGGAGGMGADPAAGGDPAAAMMAAGGTGMGGGTGGLTSANPTDYRYVDQEYKPLTGDRLISAMKGQPQKPEDLLLAVAKRVPVRIHVKMDQRRLPALLANCGNSALPVEIKQVRINRESGSSGGMTMGMGGMGGMDDAMRRGPGGASGTSPMMMDPGGDAGGAGGLGGFGGAGGTSGVRSKVADSSIDANEISVEVYGIVYIYNPVNREVLGLPPVEPAAVTPVTTPTSTTAPEATTPGPNTGAEAGKSGTPLSAVN